MRRPLGAAFAAAVVATAPARAWQLTDPLNGSTLGNQSGGSLGPNGWTVTGTTDLIWYDVPRLVSGSAEFTITGLSIAELPLVDHEIFAMYEAGYGIAEPINYNPEFRNSAYKMLVRIYGQGEPSRTGMQKLLYSICPMGAPGYNDGSGCPCPGYFNEEPFGGNTGFDGSPTTFRIEWDANGSRLSRDGVEMGSVDFASAGVSWGPNTMHLMLGSPRNVLAPDVGMPVGVTYSNLVVDGTEGPEAPSCAGTGGTGGGGAGGTSGTGSGGIGGDTGCSDGVLAAVSLEPSSGAGPAAELTATYRHAAGAAQLRIVQLWVGPQPASGVAAVQLSYEAGLLWLQGQSCAPGEATLLGGDSGSLDCQATTVSDSGSDRIVKWAVDFDVAGFGGPHGVWFDAKGFGDPEPRLCWTEMGSWTVQADGSGGSAGTASGGSSGGWADAGGATGGTAGTPSGAGGSDPASRGEAVGEDAGCGCRQQRGRAARALAALAVPAVLLRRRRRGAR